MALQHGIIATVSVSELLPTLASCISTVASVSITSSLPALGSWHHWYHCWQHTFMALFPALVSHCHHQHQCQSVTSGIGIMKVFTCVHFGWNRDCQSINVYSILMCDLCSQSAWYHCHTWFYGVSIIHITAGTNNCPNWKHLKSVLLRPPHPFQVTIT